MAASPASVDQSFHNSLNSRLNNRDLAVTVKSREQKVIRVVLLKASSGTPASNDAIRIMPCEPMLNCR